MVFLKLDEYDKLGIYVLCGLFDCYGRFMELEVMKIKYFIIVVGENFGCGFLREYVFIVLGVFGV